MGSAAEPGGGVEVSYNSGSVLMFVCEKVLVRNVYQITV